MKKYRNIMCCLKPSVVRRNVSSDLEENSNENVPPTNKFTDNAEQRECVKDQVDMAKEKRRKSEPVNMDKGLNMQAMALKCDRLSTNTTFNHVPISTQWCTALIEALADKNTPLHFYDNSDNVSDNSDSQLVASMVTAMNRYSNDLPKLVHSLRHLLQNSVPSLRIGNSSKHGFFNNQSSNSEDSFLATGKRALQCQQKLLDSLASALRLFYIQKNDQDRYSLRMPLSYQEDALLGADFTDVTIGKQHIELIIQRLPGNYRQHFNFMIKHLQAIAGRSKNPNECSENIARHWSPCFFRLNAISQQKQPHDEAQRKRAMGVMKMLIRTDDGQENSEVNDSLAALKAKVLLAAKDRTRRRSEPETKQQLQQEDKDESKNQTNGLGQESHSPKLESSIFSKKKWQYRSLDMAMKRKGRAAHVFHMEQRQGSDTCIPNFSKFPQRGTNPKIPSALTLGEPDSWKTSILEYYTSDVELLSSQLQIHEQQEKSSTNSKSNVGGSVDDLIFYLERSPTPTVPLTTE